MYACCAVDLIDVADERIVVLAAFTQIYIRAVRVRPFGMPGYFGMRLLLHVLKTLPDLQ